MARLLTVQPRVLGDFGRRALGFVVARGARWRNRCWKGTQILRDEATLYRAEWHAVRAIERAVDGTGPIIAGPWISEVGYEVLYWLPFLRRVCQRYEVDPARVVAVSRGGVAAWYRDVATRYVEIFDYMSPDEFGQRNAHRRDAVHFSNKQLSASAMDQQLLESVVTTLGLDRTHVLHPSLMYRLFHPYWYGRRPVQFVERNVRFAPMSSATEPGPEGLPDDYTAVKLYSAHSLADDSETRTALRWLIERLVEQTDVVLLDTGLMVDDHHDYVFGGIPRVTSVRNLMVPQTNLGVQTQVLSRARAFVGTCGGLAWLAPMLGVDTVAILSETRYLHTHLQLALRAYASMEAATFAPLDLRALTRLGMGFGRSGGPRRGDGGELETNDARWERGTGGS